MRKIWNFLNDLKLTYWLLLLICMNLAIGSFYLKYSFSVFHTLNRYLLQDWFQYVGQDHIGQIWWIVSLFLLLFVLFLNTWACMINRLIALLKRRQGMSSRLFWIKVAPSVIHICFIIIISGHFLSEVSGSNQVIKLAKKQVISIEDKSEPFGIRVTEVKMQKHSQPGMLKGRVKSCSAKLIIVDGHNNYHRSVSILKPVTWNGYSIHLKLTKARKDNPELVLQVKNDPGIPYIILGFALMMICMCWYFPQKGKAFQGTRKNGRDRDILVRSFVRLEGRND